MERKDLFFSPSKLPFAQRGCLGRARVSKKQSNLHGKEVFWQAGRRQSRCPEDWTAVELWRGMLFPLLSGVSRKCSLPWGRGTLHSTVMHFVNNQIKVLIQSESRGEAERRKDTKTGEEREDMKVVEWAWMQLYIAMFKCKHVVCVCRYFASVSEAFDLLYIFNAHQKRCHHRQNKTSS